MYFYELYEYDHEDDTLITMFYMSRDKMTHKEFTIRVNVALAHCTAQEEPDNCHIWRKTFDNYLKRQRIHPVKSQSSMTLESGMSMTGKELAEEILSWDEEDQNCEVYSYEYDRATDRWIPLSCSEVDCIPHRALGGKKVITIT